VLLQPGIPLFVLLQLEHRSESPNSQYAGLRRVDHCSKFVDAKHAQVGNTRGKQKALKVACPQSKNPFPEACFYSTKKR